MPTWISEAAGARSGFSRGLCLAAAIGLAGCFGEESGSLGFLSSGDGKEIVIRDVQRKVALFDGDVIVRGPGGYCIDRRSLRRDRDGGFVLLASCESLSGVRGHPVPPVLMTVSVLPGARVAARPGADEIAGLMAPAQVLARHETRDLSLVHFGTGGEGVLTGGDARHWRGAMVVNGHVIGLALYSPKGGPMAGEDGRALLTELARTLRRASPDRPATDAAAPPAGPVTPESLYGGLFPDSE